MKNRLPILLTTALCILISISMGTVNTQYRTVVFAQETMKKNAGCEVIAIVEKKYDFEESTSLETEDICLKTEEILTKETDEKTIEEEPPIIFFKHSILDFIVWPPAEEMTDPDPLRTPGIAAGQNEEQQNNIKENPSYKIIEIPDDATRTPKFWTFIRNIIWNIIVTNEKSINIGSRAITYIIIALFFILWILILLIILAVRCLVEKHK